MRVSFGLGGLAIALAMIARAEGALSDPGASPDAVRSFIETARDADIVFLGEVHDNPEHHRAQAAIVAALRPAALVFEMIPQEREEQVNELRAAGADRAALAEALDWARAGWPDFDYYAEILEAAPQAQIFGAEQPSAEVKRAMLEGAAGVFGPDAAIYGLDAQLDADDQARRERLQAEAHCGALPAEVLPGMVEAQRFREAGLADATLWARIMSGEGQVVVITGAVHADKERGAPAMIALAEPEARVVALGQFEHAPERAGAYDAVLVAQAPPRGDPCAPLSAPGE